MRRRQIREALGSEREALLSQLTEQMVSVAMYEATGPRANKALCREGSSLIGFSMLGDVCWVFPTVRG